LPEDAADRLRNVLFPNEPRPDRIIGVVVDVPDPVGHARELPLHGLRARRGLHRLEIRKNLDVGRSFRMASDAVADLPGEVQAFLVDPLSAAAALQHFDDPEALDVVLERRRSREGVYQEGLNLTWEVRNGI